MQFYRLPSHDPIDSCSTCKKHFEPEIKSHVIGTYFRTCPECRENGRQKMLNIAMRGSRPISRVSRRCEFTGKCTSCKKDISHSDSLVIGNRYYCSDCSIKIRNRRNLYHAAYISQNYEIIRRNRRRDYQNKVSACVCITCGNRTSMGHVYCDRCLKIKRDKYRSSYRNNRTNYHSPNYRDDTIRRLKIGNLFPLMSSYIAATKDHVFMPKPEPIIAIDKSKGTSDTVYNWVITTAAGTFSFVHGNKPVRNQRTYRWESSWSFEFYPITNEEGEAAK